MIECFECGKKVQEDTAFTIKHRQDIDEDWLIEKICKNCAMLKIYNKVITRSRLV